MLELVDKTDLKSVGHLAVWVRVPLEVLIKFKLNMAGIDKTYAKT